MAIPPLNRAGELPPGEHETSLATVRKRFGRLSAQRQELMRGLEEAAGNLKAAEAGSGLPFPKFFQVNRDGDPKGILVVSFT